MTHQPLTPHKILHQVMLACAKNYNHQDLSAWGDKGYYIQAKEIVETLERFGYAIKPVKEVFTLSEIPNDVFSVLNGNE